MIRTNLGPCTGGCGRPATAIVCFTNMATCSHYACMHRARRLYTRHQKTLAKRAKRQLRAIMRRFASVDYQRPWPYHEHGKAMIGNALIAAARHNGISDAAITQDLAACNRKEATNGT